jgi:hypothetical protein
MSNKKNTAEDRGYKDLHEHIEALDQAGLLVRVDREINKDTELHPLVRWQFRGGITEPNRKAFLFTNVVDGKGHKYDIPVLVGGLAANKKIYSTGMGCAIEDIGKVWGHAIANPKAPIEVTDAPCQEIVIMGEELKEPGKGIDGLPIPISGILLTTKKFLGTNCLPRLVFNNSATSSSFISTSKTIMLNINLTSLLIVVKLLLLIVLYVFISLIICKLHR